MRLVYTEKDGTEHRKYGRKKVLRKIADNLSELPNIKEILLFDHHRDCVRADFRCKTCDEWADIEPLVHGGECWDCANKGRVDPAKKCPFTAKGGPFAPMANPGGRDQAEGG